MASSYDYLEQILKRNLEGNNPLFDRMFGNAQRRIGSSTDRNVRGILQQQAQSGFRGVAANNLNNAYRTESDALSQVSDQIGQMELDNQNQAISGLMDIENMKAQETDFWDVLGGITGMGVGAFTGGVGGAVGEGLLDSLLAPSISTKKAGGSKKKKYKKTGSPFQLHSGAMNFDVTTPIGR